MGAARDGRPVGRGRLPRRQRDGRPVKTGCVSVAHDSVNCAVAGAPVGEWCLPCLRVLDTDPGDNLSKPEALRLRAEHERVLADLDGAARDGLVLADLASGGTLPVVCLTCGRAMEAVDRYASDYPPGPRGAVPEAWVEFYRRGSGGDPDDLLMECEGCGADLQLHTVAAGDSNDNDRRVK